MLKKMIAIISVILSIFLLIINSNILFIPLKTNITKFFIEMQNNSFISNFFWNVVTFLFVFIFLFFIAFFKVLNNQKNRNTTIENILLLKTLKLLKKKYLTNVYSLASLNKYLYLNSSSTDTFNNLIGLTVNEDNFIIGKAQYINSIDNNYSFNIYGILIENNIYSINNRNNKIEYNLVCFIDENGFVHKKDGTTLLIRYNEITSTFKKIKVVEFP